MPARHSVTNGGVLRWGGTNWRCTASTFQTSRTGWGFLNSAQTVARGAEPECTKCCDFSAIPIAIFRHTGEKLQRLSGPQKCQVPFIPTKRALRFLLRRKIASDCDSFCDFSTKKTAPLRFGWRRGRLRQKIVAICDCDFWCSQGGTRGAEPGSVVQRFCHLFGAPYPKDPKIEKFQSCLNFSILTFRIPHKNRGLVGLKCSISLVCSISLENFNPEERS